MIQAFTPFRFRIDSLRLCEISGSDSEDFLQRLFTNDLKLARQGRAQLTSWCNIKGRVTILLRLIKYHDSFFLIVDDFNLGKLIQDLNKYIFNSDVSVTDVSSKFSLYVNYGEDTKNKSNLLIEEGALSWELEKVEDRKRHEATHDKQNIGGNSFAMYRINNLIPSLPKNLCDQFLPQEINLDKLGGLSFNKGCFPGQEIIARVKYRGKVKKRLKSFKTQFPHQSTKEVAHLTNESGVKAGIIIDSAKDSNNFLHVLAVYNETISSNLFLDQNVPVISNE